MIDIENLLYFDVEWEHVFLRLRHTESQYQRPAVDGLDEDRLALRQPGNGRTSEPETTSTRPDLLVSHSRAAGEPQRPNPQDSAGRRGLLSVS
ncbi:hypothetical protein [Streptomyces sp. NPDC050121]|uniref:hypothetical protein n=1 Tax=Streptomyces sp. NPDC050121 TaxID=3365601 RepID=UPI0037B9E092